MKSNDEGRQLCGTPRQRWWNQVKAAEEDAEDQSRWSVFVCVAKYKLGRT